VPPCVSEWGSLAAVSWHPKARPSVPRHTPQRVSARPLTQPSHNTQASCALTCTVTEVGRDGSPRMTMRSTWVVDV
jgi:hypothetical protein